MSATDRHPVQGVPRLHPTVPETVSSNAVTPKGMRQVEEMVGWMDDHLWIYYKSVPNGLLIMIMPPSRT